LIFTEEFSFMGFKKYTLAAALLIGAAQLISAPANAAGKTCKLDITGNDAMQYDKTTLAVAADCTEVELTLKHIGKLPAQAMGHNWVLSKPADAGPVATAGLAAGLKANYVPADDKRVIAHTKVVGGGESDTIKFPTSALKKGETYAYECTFPGHNAIMKGTLKFG
jgi:azurin